MQTARFSDRDRQAHIQGWNPDGTVNVFIHGQGIVCIQKSDLIRIKDGRKAGNDIENHQTSVPQESD